MSKSGVTILSSNVNDDQCIYFFYFRKKSKKIIIDDDRIRKKKIIIIENVHSVSSGDVQYIPLQPTQANLSKIGIIQFSWGQLLPRTYTFL